MPQFVTRPARNSRLECGLIPAIYATCGAVSGLALTFAFNAGEPAGDTLFLAGIIGILSGGVGLGLGKIAEFCGGGRSDR